MPKKPDWAALGEMFNCKPPPCGAKSPSDHRRFKTEAPLSSGVDTQGMCYVCYLGELLPKWMARDLIQERAAILEFEGGLPRLEAEALARKGLKK